MKWTSCLRVHGTAVTPRRPWDQANAAIHYPLTFFHPIRPEDCNANSIQGCTERRRDGGGVEKSFFFFFLITHLSLRPLQPQWKKKTNKKNTCIIHNQNKTGQSAVTHLTRITNETHVSSEMFPLPLHVSQFNHHCEMWFFHMPNMYLN